jgi:hypothetical protein
MIKANESRIGNLVQTNFKREKEIIDIKAIDFIEDYFKLYEPIPLTEEWLLKFGFNEIGGCNEKDFTNGDYNIFINSLGEVNFLFFREGDWYQKLDYVHQLQNLFFALTQTELK